MDHGVGSLQFLPSYIGCPLENDVSAVQLQECTLTENMKPCEHFQGAQSSKSSSSKLPPCDRQHSRRPLQSSGSAPKSTVSQRESARYNRRGGHVSTLFEHLYILLISPKDPCLTICSLVQVSTPVLVTLLQPWTSFSARLPHLKNVTLTTSHALSPEP